MNKKVDPIMINDGINSSGKKNKLTLKFPSNIDFYNKEVALGYLGLYYSWQNVSGPTTANGLTGWNNNSFSYTWVNGTTYPVNLPQGFYTISDLVGYMQKNVMVPNGHFMLDANGRHVYFIDFVANSTYYAVTLTCKPIAVPVGGSNPNTLPLGKVPQLNIPNFNEFGKLLGFNSGSYPTEANTTVAFYINSQNVPKISPVTTVYVHCNLSESNSTVFTHAISQFSPKVGYNQYIDVSPNNLVYYNVSDGSYREISVYFTDQNGQPIDIIDPDINVTLLIRDK